jgi:hypothetical protein
MDLYADYHPQTSVKGFGFSNAEKARVTLKMLEDGRKKKNREIYQKIQENPQYEVQVVVTMYHRAKHHPRRTLQMEEAMTVYEKFLRKKGVKLGKKDKNDKKSGSKLGLKSSGKKKSEKKKSRKKKK